ncbi:zinc/manganese transport system permease protein [Andreprevotia lacus DSM 23236]|jgi:zinc/manganese transport system permease protein|uniref:Zinc/manganese transport system permease protein n=1 Tax=Andreprevotia lacus DSM 23236 TaxID=1121001 RepID=A0A1W1Y0H4_9NEIS|nr:metal ABC transporter permease [Andreprevotia lacus]SMC29632.1 zinc/manganese transport system permease protein [Andreprevotia lacus DSM 23236]
MTLYELFLAPFAEFAFMRLALVGCFALALGCAPIGLFLVLRRMSLVGDAMSHAILPGAAIAFIAYGLSLTALSIGGLIAGLTVVLLSGLVTRLTQQKEDASFAAFYLLSLASGVLIVSKWGSNVDLMHILFGTVLAVDPPALLLVAGIATVTLLGLALFYRPLVLESFDSEFLRVTSGGGALAHFVFLVLVVLNLVAGFQALGTLMAVGLMMLPATSARMWANSLPALLAIAIGFALLAGYLGLLVSYHANLPSGPSIILMAGAGFVVSLLFGRQGGLAWRVLKFKHLEG